MYNSHPYSQISLIYNVILTIIDPTDIQNICMHEREEKKKERKRENSIIRRSDINSIVQKCRLRISTEIFSYLYFPLVPFYFYVYSYLNTFDS